MTRPRITGREPVHVTLRTVPGVRYLRNRHTCAAVRHAMAVVARRQEEFRICQLSLQDGHLHLIVEASGHLALARGMQGFQIALARRLNRILTRRNGFDCRGQVFADRYHARVLRSPSQTRNALRYVLSNFRRHGHDRGGARHVVVDPYSTAAGFDGWCRRVPRDEDGPLADAPLAPARSWLLAAGWRRAGPLDPTEACGPA